MIRALFKKPALWMCLALGTGTACLYGKVHNFQYVHYDDQGYVFSNPRVQQPFSFESVLWAFTSGELANWHPLTWLSHMADWRLFGSDAGKHHLVNVFFHALNAALLFAVLFSYTGAPWRSFFVSAFFAFHPINIESVAWISERKNVLCTLFFLLTLLAYREWTLRRGARRYAAALLLFAAGLAAKPMVVTLPFVLLLLDYWPLQRMQGDLTAIVTKKNRALILEKWPFFLLSAAVSVATFFVQKAGGAVASLAAMPVEQRFSNVMVSYCKYLWKTLWPSGLATTYQYEAHIPGIIVSLATLALMAACAAAIIGGRRSRFLATGWFWYAGTLVPVIGIVQVGSQSMADRYAYIPLIGIFVAVVWGVHALLRGRRLPLAAVSGVAVIASAGLAAASWRQLDYWRDDDAFYGRAASITRNPVMIKNYANYLDAYGRPKEAEKFFLSAWNLVPFNFPYLFELGQHYLNGKKWTEAVLYLYLAQQLDSTSAVCHAELSRALEKTGDIPNAIRHLGRAVALMGDTAEAGQMNTLAWYLATIGNDTLRRPKEALALAERACNLTDNLDPWFLDTKATAMAATGDFSGAVALEEKALRLAAGRNELPLSKEIESRQRLFREKKMYTE